MLTARNVREQGSKCVTPRGNLNLLLARWSVGDEGNLYVQIVIDVVLIVSEVLSGVTLDGEVQ